MQAPEICPNCGAEVPPKAKACPGCGSDETTGWSEDAQRENLGIPDDRFDYDDFVKREFEGAEVKPRGLPWGWWIVGVILLIAFVLMFFR